MKLGFVLEFIVFTDIELDSRIVLICQKELILIQLIFE